MLRTEKNSRHQSLAPEAGAGLGLSEVRELALSLGRKITRMPGLSLATGANTLPSLVRHLLGGLEAPERAIAKKKIN